MKFDILSPRADFKSKFQLNKLDLINKNILYLTHEVDKCVSLLKLLQTNFELQKQVDDYFEEDSHSVTPPLEDKEPD